MRLGLTSVAAIEFDESTASTTVVCFWSLAISAWGRATPTSSEAEGQQQKRRAARDAASRAGAASGSATAPGWRRLARCGGRGGRTPRTPTSPSGTSDERDQQVGVGERHVILRSAQEEAAAAASSTAAMPATTNVSSFCSFVELTRVPMRS